MNIADCIAIFRAGRLEQFAAPDELLARPANDFVAGFVGTDRTLKRLRLIHVSDVMTPANGDATPAAGPAVSPGDDLRRVAPLFLEPGVAALPCVDGARRRVGSVTREAVAARLAEGKL